MNSERPLRRRSTKCTFLMRHAHSTFFVKRGLTLQVGRGLHLSQLGRALRGLCRGRRRGTGTLGTTTGHTTWFLLGRESRGSRSAGLLLLEEASQLVDLLSGSLAQRDSRLCVRCDSCPHYAAFSRLSPCTPLCQCASVRLRRRRPGPWPCSGPRRCPGFWDRGPCPASEPWALGRASWAQVLLVRNLRRGLCLSDRGPLRESISGATFTSGCGAPPGCSDITVQVPASLHEGVQRL